MPEPGDVLGWGLWNQRLTEWFNPGTRKPYYPTKEAAERMIPLAQRQYPFGKWELLEYRAQDEESEDAPSQVEASGAGR